ncbi:MAG: B-box zinc finger protein [Deltaproteobacteria bacterium]|nr:B-box zinc finger protein [Deltaproteobacteria bacterium]
MKCSSHPYRNAEFRCVSCRKPLCEDCAIEIQDGKYGCMNCSLRSTLEEINERRHEKISSRNKKETEKEAKKKKKAYLRILIPVSVGLVIAIVELLLYYKITSTREVGAFQPDENPSAFVIVIRQAISDYSRDHKGVAPGRLEELLGKYLPKESVSAMDLEAFHYERRSHYSYVLEPRYAPNDLPVDLVFTDQGLILEGSQ